MAVLFISSTGIDHNTGSGRLEIEGQLTVPNQCDDPIIELFRPIRLDQKDEMFFVVLLSRREHSITCSLVPSNHKHRPEDVFIKDALSVLKGDAKKAGMLEDYKAILELFFAEKSGLDLWIKAREKGDYAKCNEIIKRFVAEIGLIMPSRKPKPKKTKAEKKASSEAYLAEHPEKDKRKKNRKKPTN